MTDSVRKIRPIRKKVLCRYTVELTLPALASEKQCDTALACVDNVELGEIIRRAVGYEIATRPVLKGLACTVEG